MNEPTELRRSISLPFLIFYGVGTMVGGGFYALLGKIAGEAGLFTPMAFAFSGVLALLSAFSFAELSSRFPVSAGEAQYVREGFDSQAFASAIGWLVITTGVVSAATLSVATIGFLRDFVAIHPRLGIFLLVLGMGALTAWGVTQSVAVVAVITVIEVAALIYAGIVAGDSLGQLPDRWPELVPNASAAVWTSVFAGAFIAFYGFVGFEDMVNMAEEVKNVRRNLPIGVLVALVVTTVLYVAVSLVAVLAVPPADLAESRTPIAEMVRQGGWYSTTGIGIVSLLTGLNGALVQIVMASRVAYGMAQRHQAPAWLGFVHPKTQTPLYATIVITGVILALALFFPLTTLAKITSAIILVIFASVNLALWRIKKTAQPDPDPVGPRFPAWLPLLGFLACAAVLVFQAWLTLTGSQ